MRRNLKISLNLYIKKSLTKKEYDSIYATESRPQILYGSANIHKLIIDNCHSFCPILFTIGSPTYILAKFLVPILSPLTVNEFTIHDSLSFAEEIVNFDTDCIMASLDTESLFANTPLEETIENCTNELFLLLTEFGILSKKTLKNFSNLLPMSCVSHLIREII